MAKQISIPIVLTVDDRASQAVVKAVQGVDKATIQASKSAAVQAQALARLDQAQARSAHSAARLAQTNNQAAISAQKLAQATIKTAADQDRAALAALRLAAAQEKANKPPSKGLTGYFDSLKSEAASAAAGVIGFTAALSAAQAVGQSFVDAFNFKAQLDASTASINVQLAAVRDTGQVWQEAAAYADQYKLTQAQTVQAIGASVNVLKNSSASVGQTLEALQRLNLANTQESIEGAAFALAELASGDINSIVERFRVSRDEAYAMRDAIAAGADPVAVLVGYLDKAGLSAEALRTQTEGVTGAQKDAAIAAEQLALAQAAFASGPGLAFLEAQTDATLALASGFGDLQTGIELFSTSNYDLNTSLSATAGTIQQLASSFTGNAMAAQQAGDAAQEATSKLLTWLGVAQQATPATQQNTAATEQNTTATQASTTATQAATAASLTDAQQKQINAVETQLLALENERLAQQAQLAAANVMAAGGNIQAEAARLAASSSFIDQLTVAYLRLAMAQQGVTGERSLGIGRRGRKTSEVYATPGIAAPGKTGTSDVDAVVRLQKAQADAAKAQLDQERAIAQAKGDTAAQIRIEQAELAKLVPGTAPYIEQQTKILQLQSQRAGGAAKAGKAAVSAEQKTSGEILAIAQDTAEKLRAIDERVANERIRAAEKLAQTLRETALQTVADQEADDLDLIGASEDQAAELADREAAQAKARISQIEAVKEAQRVADEEGADVAQATFEARQEQIQSQQELDQKYYEKQRELAGDDEALAALKTQYDEATAAYEARAANQIAVAQAEAAAKAQAIEAEKQAVLSSAAEQAAALGNTGKAAGSAESRVNDLARALANLPKNVSTTITINEQRSSSGGSSSSAGGTSGGGASAPAPAPSAPPKTNTNRVGAASSGRVSSQSIVDDAANAAIGTLQGGTTPALPTTGGGKSSGGGGGGAAASSDPADQLKAIEQAIAVLDKIAELRTRLAEVGPPIDMALVNQLSQEAFDSAQALGSRFVQLSKEQGENFEIFTGALENAISVLSDAASLRKDLVEIGPPINLETVNQLAAEAFAASQALGSLFVHLTEQQGENFEIFTDALQNAIAPLSDAAALRKDLIDIGPPINGQVVNALAREAKFTLTMIQNTLIPLSEEQAEALERFTSAEGAAIGVLSDAAALRADLAEPQPAVTPEYLQSLAQTAAQATAVVQNTLLPVTEEQADALSRYADAAGSSVSVLADVASLTQDLFANYQSPTDAQIAILATDAQRITNAFMQSAATLEQSDGAKAWAEAVGATFQAASTGLETIDRINLTQVTVDQGQLDSFKASSLAILDTMQVLGERASQIPLAGIAALQTITAATNAQSEMLINMAAVPFGNLSGAAGAFGGMGGGSPITIMPGAIQIHQLPGETNNALADRVITRIGQRFGDRR